METKLIVSSSPHVKMRDRTSGIMLDVIIALAPATVFGIIIFGFSALVTVAVTVAAAVAADTPAQKTGIYEPSTERGVDETQTASNLTPL
mgnify:CR=1 FL=1